MVDIWLISDTHFGHANIIKYCNRPFADAEEMDAVLIENWNRTVKPQDHVYHLGDVAVSPQRLHQVLPRLLGHKRLILGNHDNHAPMADYVKHFERIMCWRLFKPLLLTHVPIHPDSFGKAAINVHGHTHEKGSPVGPYYSVCVERQQYAPVHLEEVAHRLGVRLG